MKKKILRKKFSYYINEIKKYHEKIDNLNEAIRLNCEDGIYAPPSLEAALIDLLVTAMDDEYEVIDYFIYQLNFGEKWESGDLLINDKDIKLKTIDDLYDFLTEE